MELTTLGSGLRIASERISYVQTVSLGFWVRCGTFAETEEEHGLSHFLEHMFFKGTHNFSARDIVESFDDVGGEVNAYTTKEYTCYYAKVMAENLGLAVRVLSDMLARPLFSAEDIEREKQIVLEEIASYEDAPEELIHDKLADAIWPHHPLGRPILGTKESVSRITPEALWQFYRRHYSPGNIVVAACGSLDHGELVDLLATELTISHPHFAFSGNGLDRPYVENISIIERPIEQLHLCLGFPGLSWRDENIYSMNVLNNIFGAGMSSRIFQGIREELGLAYNIYSYSASFVAAGYFAVYAGLSARNATKLLSTMSKELTTIKNTLVSPQELGRAKQQVKGALVFGLESPANRMSRMGRGLLLIDRVMDTTEVLERIEAVTLEDVHLLANQVFRLDQLTVCAMGPTASLPDMAQAIRVT